MRHDLCELSIGHKNLYGRFNTRRYISVHGFCYFKLFLMVGKGLTTTTKTTGHLHSEHVQTLLGNADDDVNAMLKDPRMLS